MILGILSLFLLVQCGEEASPAAESAVGSQPSIAAIQRAYTMKCSLCHGNDGKLMASKAPDLSLVHDDLRRTRRHHHVWQGHDAPAERHSRCEYHSRGCSVH